jgi:rhamnosyl/mannosyltransferase
MSFYNPLLKKFYERADRIIVATPKHLECSPFLSIFYKKCRVVPFGIVLEEYELNNEKTKAIQELNREVPIILFVGRLVYYKGIDILIRSMTDIQAKLLIIGTGPLESALKKLTLQLNLDKKVKFLGPVKYEDLVFYYHACDFLVLPSVANSEMFGMVQIEAMACRKPVISTNLPTGVSWVNQNGITGLLVTPGNVSALSQAIRKLIENPALRQEMGEAGRKRVEENFTREKMVEGVLDVYREISC